MFATFTGRGDRMSIGAKLDALMELAWGYGMRPGWRSYRFAVITTLAWGAFTFIFNTIAGTDYRFLNRKRLNASLLNFLGPWPFYVLADVGIVGAFGRS